MEASLLSEHNYNMFQQNLLAEFQVPNTMNNSLYLKVF